MQIRLIIEKGSRTRSVFVVRGPDMVIGRQIGCHLRIPSAAVSRRHCLLSTVHDSLSVRDLGSANGTLVNGREIRGEQSLFPGDRLQIGPVTFLVEFANLPSGRPRSDPVFEMPDHGFELIDDKAPLPEEEQAELDDAQSSHFDWTLLPDLVDDWEIEEGN